MPGSPVRLHRYIDISVRTAKLHPDTQSISSHSNPSHSQAQLHYARIDHVFSSSSTLATLVLFCLPPLLLYTGKRYETKQASHQIALYAWNCMPGNPLSHVIVTFKRQEPRGVSFRMWSFFTKRKKDRDAVNHKLSKNVNTYRPFRRGSRARRPRDAPDTPSQARCLCTS
jgi:hypothetical protein